MSCKKWDFCLTAGTNRSFNVVWETGGNPVELTGAQILMKIRKLGASSNDLEIDSEAALDSTLLIPAPLTGSIDVLIHGLDTDNFIQGKYCYEITNNTTRELIIKGFISVEKGL